MELLIYLFKVSICMALFFGFYLLAPRKLTFFKLNRFYLLGGLLLSFSIPASHFTIEKERPQQLMAEVLPIAEVAQSLQTGEMPIITNAVTIEKSFNWYLLLPYLYGVVVICLLMVTAWKLIQLFRYTRTKAANINGLKLVPKSVGFTNCSFFNYVFIDDKNLNEAELEVLLRHEEVHAKQLHSVDKILMMIAKAVLWFNPIIYLYDKALEEAHEYEADDTTSKNFGAAPYAALLLKLAVSKNEMPLVHNFVKSPVKQRIKMLFVGKSTSLKKLVYLLVMPIGLVLIWGFTINVVEVAPKSTSHAPSLSSVDSLNVFKNAVKYGKRTAFLTPKIISSESIFMDASGDINHYKGAKIRLFDGLLSADDAIVNLKLKTLVALNAKCVFDNGYVVKGDTIEFDLVKGGAIVKRSAAKELDNRPKLISSKSLRVDTKSDISYIKNGTIEIGGDRLSAEEIVWDARNKTLTAKTATLSLATGKIVSDKYIIYDIEKRTYTTNSSAENKIRIKSAAYQLLSRLTIANDSMKLVKVYDMIALMGGATINLDNYSLKGRLITGKENSNTLTVHDGTLTDKNGKVVSAEELEFDVATKKYKIIKN